LEFGRLVAVEGLQTRILVLQRVVLRLEYGHLIAVAGLQLCNIMLQRSDFPLQIAGYRRDLGEIARHVLVRIKHCNFGLVGGLWCHVSA
jgi:hypothetical protein